MKPSAQSLRGAHPFRPQCLLDAIRLEVGWLDAEGLESPKDDEVVAHAHDLIKMIDQFVCPRCGSGRLRARFSAGSTITTCRCIPVCDRCGSDELLADYFNDSFVAPLEWPISEYLVPDMTQASFSERAIRNRQRFIDTFEHAGPAAVAHPGGWLEHGYDDTADRHERER